MPYLDGCRRAPEVRILGKVLNEKGAPVRLLIQEITNGGLLASPPPTPDSPYFVDEKYVYANLAHPARYHGARYELTDAPDLTNIPIIPSEAAWYEADTRRRRAKSTALP